MRNNVDKHEFTGKFIIIDGNSLANRAFYALPPLATTAGEYTNAVYGFTTMLLRLLDEEKPALLAVAFDKAAPTFRHMEYEGYKAQRKGMPDELAYQLPWIKEVARAFGASIFEIEGFEADDIIGTLTLRAEESGYTNLIVTGDRDALQLVSPATKVMLTRKGISEMEVYDEDAVLARYGLAPAQMIDVKGLMGDASDNIPGVPGIGEKTAIELVKVFGSLENLVENLDKVSRKRQQDLIRANVELARMSKRLATIERNVPIEIDLQQCRVGKPDRAALREIFTRFQFKSLMRRLEDIPGAIAGARGEAHSERPASQVSGSDASCAVAVPGAGAGSFTIVSSPEGLYDVAARLEGCNAVAFELLLEGPRPMQSSLAGIGLLGISSPAPGASRPGCDGEAFYIPVAVVDRGPAGPTCALDGAPGERMRENEALAALRGILENLGIQKICHDAKPKLEYLKRHNIELRGLSFDTMVASYLVDPGAENHSLGAVAREQLGVDLPDPGSLISKSRRGGGNTPMRLSDVDAAAIGDIVCRGLRLLPELAGRLGHGIKHDGMEDLFRRVEMPLIEVLARMEMQGVSVDVPRLKELSDDMNRRIKAIEEEIYWLAGEEFNINSPKQLGSILFEKLRLPAGKKTKTGRSTDAKVLEGLAGRHEIARKILEYRELVKLKSTYADALGGLINPVTGRIHTTFNQTVTATGRLSSSDPNLQNIPIRKEEGRKIRQVFTPGKDGWLIMSADYSQIELRILAHFSGDPNLIEAFQKGEDIHARTAAQVYGVPLDIVSEEMRSRAKAVNFGIVYGISDYGLAQGVGMGRAEARKFIDRYFWHYKGVRRYLDETIEAARRQGYVTTLLNRRRYLPDLHSPKVPVRKFAERTAMNTPIQGTAADIIKLAMVAVDKEIAARGLISRMILQVHDELVFEVPEEELDIVGKLVRDVMENAVQLSVPLKVDVKAGPNWLDMEPL
ncbi:MAG: DNA polymerase I [Firmicutes bacterium]|nr:DNA polymerase I [Bacillota bacterium]